MIKNFQAGIVDCVQALTDQESQDFCWKGGRYFLKGDWAQPSVGLIVGLAQDPLSSAQPAHPFSVSVEPILFAQGTYGQRVSNVQILNAREMLIEEATDLRVAQILFQSWQRYLCNPGGETKSNLEEPGTEAGAMAGLLNARTSSQR